MSNRSEQGRWDEELRLVEDLRPPPGLPTTPGNALLTGATGYLGGHVLRNLLDRYGVVHCLARSKDEVAAADRVFAALEEVPGGSGDLRERVKVYEADLAAPRLGLSRPAYETLAGNTSVVVHCAADVSWSRRYSALRAANVLPVAELLRFACTGAPKHFSLVSTMAVGYSRNETRCTDEETDPWAYLAEMPLGYAQSKCVAEQLVRRAAAEGLSASIVRPALLLSDRGGRRVNTQDFVSWMIQGCVRLGYAPDVDWKVDVVPVDYASAAVVRHARPLPGLRVLHVAHPQPREWREVVLFLNLCGHAVRLEPFDEWCERLRGADPALPLRRFLAFFTEDPYGAQGPSLSRIYEYQGPPRVSSSRSHAELQRLELPFPDLDARYFARYVSALGTAGVLPSPEKRAARVFRDTDDHSALASLRALDGSPAGVDLSRLRFAPFRAAHSITSEIASWRYGGRIGLYGVARNGHPDAADDRDAEFLLKVHALDAEKLDTAFQVASACSERLGRQFLRYGDSLEFTGAERRELAAYALSDEAIRRHAPACYGTGRDAGSGRALLLLERLRDVDLLDSVERPQDWTARHLEHAVRDLAALHAPWYGRVADLPSDAWSSFGSTCEATLEMRGLWSELCRHADPFLTRCGGERLSLRAYELLRTLEDWLPRYAAQTPALIHNDCNPRNLAFRRGPSGPTLCLYDWELSSLAPPQRDLAELLCFVLDEGRAGEARPLVELHRRELSRRTGVLIDPASWHEGFALALADFMVRRLALYAMLHSFARQSFLPRVLHSWQALDAAARRERPAPHENRRASALVQPAGHPRRADPYRRHPA